MSGFLERHLLRAYGAAAPEIRPRLPSLFEPVAIREPWSEASEPGAAVAPPAARAVPAVAGPDQGERGQAETAPPAPMLRGVAAADAAAPREDRPEPAPPGPLSRRTARERQALAPEPPAHRALAAPPPPLPAPPAREEVDAVETSPAHRLAVPRPATLPAIDAGPRRRSQGQREAPQQPLAVRRRSRGPEDLVEPAPPSRPPGPVGAVRGGSRAPGPATPPALMVEDGGGAGTIEVTIGRIEVRATPAPPPARRPERAGPSALDAYLQKKAGGRP